MSLSHAWWSTPALAGAAKPNRAAAKPLATMVANADFFMIFPLLACLPYGLCVSAGGRSRRSSVLNQQVRGLIPVAEIDRGLAACVRDRAHHSCTRVAIAADRGRGANS